MTDIAFDNPLDFHLLWLAALAALAGVWALLQRRRSRQLLASAHLLPRLTTPAGWLRSLARLTLITAALTLLTIAIANPRWGEQEQRLGTRGIDVMILLDASRSMLADDVKPSRLDRARVAITQDLLPRLAGDRVGLIAFAGVASIKCPLTNDYGFFRLALDDVSPDTMPQGGSLIGDAIRTAATGFDNAPNTHKIVLLITDGEDQDSFPIEAARKLWDERRIPVIALALGDDREGARIPLTPGGKSEFVKFRGEEIRSKAHFEQLRQIAGISKLHGFVPVGTQDFDLGDIYRQRIVPAMQAGTELESQVVKRPSQYHGFALVALILLLIETFMREAPRRPRSAAVPAPAGSAATRPSATRNAAAAPVRSTAAALILVAACAFAPATRAENPAAKSAREYVDDGNRLFAEAKYGDALSAYEKAAADPTAPFQAEILHNLAAAHFKLGDYDRARDFWMRAASLKDAKFEASARYNLGNCRHAHAVDLQQRAFREQSRESRKRMEEAVADLDQALIFYRDALKLRDDLADARANLELAATLRAQLVAQLRADCNENGVPDAVELQKGEAQDCNQNGILDVCDIRAGVSKDCDKNKVPDECQDCNQNGVPDDCDIRDRVSQDCNRNKIPDECETDCNKNGIPDDCDIRAAASGDCNKNGIPDECEDCNNNGVPDVQDIANGTSQDCDKNCVPDECEPDCNKNGITDACDIRDGVSADCDKNGIPDECQDCNKNNIPDAQDIAAGTSQDCNKNCIPDECEPDCNQNHIADECDIRDGTSKDENKNRIPDECEKPQSQPSSQPNQKPDDQQQDQQKQDQQQKDQQKNNQQQNQDQQQQNQQQDKQQGEQSGDQKQDQGEKKQGQQEQQQPGEPTEGDQQNQNNAQSGENKNENRNSDERQNAENRNAQNQNQNASENQNASAQSEEERQAEREAERQRKAEEAQKTEEQRKAEEQRQAQEQKTRDQKNAASQPTHSQPASQPTSQSVAVDPTSQPGEGSPTGVKVMLTREQAERLLQKIRDVERQRRLEKLKRESGRYRPAEKDW